MVSRVERVLPWDIVDNSKGPCERLSGLFFRSSAYLIGCFLHEFPRPSVLSFTGPPLPCRGSLLALQRLWAG
jgi:hypothetical protein